MNQARADVTVGTEAQYQSAISGSEATIKITKDFEISSPTEARKSSTPLTLESADGQKYRISANPPPEQPIDCTDPNNPCGDDDDDDDDDIRALELDASLKGIRNLEFAKFELDDNGGALLLKGGVNGNMENVSFIENTSYDGSGGGFYVNGDFKGNLDKGTFKKNVSEQAGGGFAIWGDFTGELKNSRFEENQTEGAGGGFAVLGFDGTLSNSQFIGNKTESAGLDTEASDPDMVAGGALAALSGIRRVENSLFIGNEAIHAKAENGVRVRGGKGGAVYLGNARINSADFVNNNFLNNKAQSAATDEQADNGRGGAIYFDYGAADPVTGKRQTQAASLGISASDGSRSLFYGNTNGSDSAQTANALHIALAEGAKGAAVNLTIDTQGSGRVLMFDPISQSNSSDANWRTQVNKTGSGEWALGGKSDMLGDSRWNIQEGRLTLANVRYDSLKPGTDAEINLAHEHSTFALSKGATLQGQGSIRADSIDLNGTLNPGLWSNSGVLAKEIEGSTSAADINAIDLEKRSDFGHLKLASSKGVHFGADFKYQVQIDPTVENGYDRITVEGDATIDKAAQFFINGVGGASVQSNWSIDKDYTILAASGSLTNNANLASKDEGGNVTYNDVLNNMPMLRPELHKEGNELQFRMVDRTTSPGGSGGSGSGAGTVNVSDFCGNANECAVGHALDGLNSSGANQPLLDAVKKTQSEDMDAMYNNLSGEVYGSTRAAVMSNNRLSNRVQARMLSLGAERLASVRQPVLFASNSVGYGSSQLNSTAQRLWLNSWGYDGHTDGSRSTERTDHSGSGFALGGDRRSRTDVESYSLGSYISASAVGMDWQGGLIYSHLDLDSSRNIVLTGLNEKAKASYQGYKVQAFAEAAKTLRLSSTLKFAPYVNLAQTWLHSDEAKEKGSSAALVSKAQSDSVLQSTLGVRPSWLLPTQAVVSLNGNLGWVHAFGDTKAKTTNSFAGTSNSFVVDGARINRDQAVAGAGVEAHVAPNTTLSVGYEGQFGSNYRNHSANVQFKWDF